MTNYFKWDTKTITDFSESNIAQMYDEGYVFTRVGKGIMNQTRSLRINLKNFSLNSENRRVLRKTDGLKMFSSPLPLCLADYDWRIQKLGKDYYETKFGKGVFSANKIKELVTDIEKSNFNLLLRYIEKFPMGYAICYGNNEILHYAYPFYNLLQYQNNYGMAMMLGAIIYAQESHLCYIYLGSASKPADKYKLQFEGLEWFDGQNWQNDLGELNKIINS